MPQDSTRSPDRPRKRKRKRDNDKDQSNLDIVVRVDCKIGHPPVRGVKNRPCRICGYVIKNRTVKQIRQNTETSVQLLCCKKEAHIACWENSRKNSLSTLCCSEIQHWLNKDQRSIRKVTRLRQMRENA